MKESREDISLVSNYAIQAHTEIELINPRLLDSHKIAQNIEDITYSYLVTNKKGKECKRRKKKRNGFVVFNLFM